MNPELIQRIALLGAGALVGGGAAYAYLKRSQPGPTAVSVPSRPLPPGTSTVPLPHTLQTPAGSLVLSPRHADMLKYGMPQSTQLQLKSNFVSLIDYRLREPVWVLEHLTRDSLKGQADRANVGFTQDQDVPKLFRQSNDDYLKSGYSRGHMSPASNNKNTPEAMKESFLLTSNIVPQDLDNNMFYWNRMERWVKDLATKKGFDSVRVISGPLFCRRPRLRGHRDDQPGLVPATSATSNNSTAILASPPSDIFHPPGPNPSEPTSSMIPGKPFNYVAYKTIGDTQVAVPTHLYKAVLAEKSQGPGKPPALFYSSFIVPNTHIPDHVPLKAFQVPKDTLQKYAGVQIFDRAFEMVPVTDLCAVQDPNVSKHSTEGRTMCQLEHAGEFKLFTIERDLAKARSKQDVDKYMAQAQQVAAKFNMPVPENLLKTYEKVSKSVS
ncbi:hypothetical protein BCR44DRAFT_1442940 [Catenaria anguillulae PL171]|uniref:Endonuclease n=1 Tax=Catenaria anguillulae PL171 TaxID=765915 RepID=A0A1Y2HDP2_9FUNG|nr:hypothetical protein BCR44DRAFT_1442940 [Catenaria anguillulae PL171]